MLTHDLNDSNYTQLPRVVVVRQSWIVKLFKSIAFALIRYD